MWKRGTFVEARAAGADCVLLIAECLDQSTLADLHGCIVELGMQALIEIYKPENLDRVLSIQPALLGINNRNLKTFETTLDTTRTLSKLVPADRMIVCESGLNTPEELADMARYGARSFLIGESLMRQDDVAAATRHLLANPSTGAM